MPARPVAAGRAPGAVRVLTEQPEPLQRRVVAGEPEVAVGGMIPLGMGGGELLEGELGDGLGVAARVDPVAANPAPLDCVRRERRLSEPAQQQTAQA
eukprot:SAG25_NODE_4211_length_863_cov_1.158377_2_plen_97_part_00